MGFVYLNPIELLKVSCKHAACSTSILVSLYFQCDRNSKSLPLATINVVKNHPEMSDWVHSIHYKAPFYVSNNNYIKIAVDSVQAADQRMYNVLLLSTGVFSLETRYHRLPREIIFSTFPCFFSPLFVIFAVNNGLEKK